MRAEFTEVYQGLPAKTFVSTGEAARFTYALNATSTSYRTKLINPPKRLKQPMKIVVMFLGEKGV